MNEKTFRVLEYDKIIQMLSQRAVSAMAKNMCLELKPSHNIYEVKERLAETKEAFEVVLKWGSLPLDGIKNIDEIIKKARKGITLTPGELLYVCDILRCCRRLKAFMKDGSKNESYPIIFEIIDSLVHIKSLEDAIEAAVISEDELDDRASEKLYSLRRSIRDKNSKVREKLQSMVVSYGKYLQDPIVTIRGDRYVIPVKAEHRGSVPGLVHDQSSSGSTLFIEPMAVVELNNDIKELLIKERVEIERILAELTSKVEDNADVLEHNNINLAFLDFLMAKAKFGLDLNGSIPEINDKGIINLKAARHPLIEKDKVVPIDIRLGETYNSLVITGPNTGGKTVTLKTAGLLTLMTMAGLAIPVRDGSVVSVFKNVFADIGDEQSIEQSLSTFSSHMTNIVDIIKNVDDKSFVLVDELGAGTDPTEGAALAMAILETFFKRGAKTIATTHYSEIKVFAMETQGFENASVEFSIETLRPTYRLLIGIPGKSNAFEISKRLGLVEDIVDRAKEFISKDAAKFEDVIQNLQNKTVLVEKELEEAERERREASSIKKDLQEKKYKLDTQRDKIVREAQEEAKRIVKQAKAEADMIIKELNELRGRINDAAAMKEAEEARKKLKDKLNSIQVKDVNTLPIKDGMVPVEKVKAGEEVYVTTLGQKAVVLSEADSKNEVMVQIGIMKVSVPIDKLMKDVTKKKEVKKTGTSGLVKQKTMNVSSSIDLRGQTLDEALYNIDKYLDDAFLAGLESVSIIHGKGTGVLREGIQSALRKHHHVKSIRMGDFSEGGSGVTVVEIKK
ncbi:DNA mismatch repair protein MutS [Fervidicella metallireducens AeB]|uniref:Endonuclease MutS2 n=1 Tax=Fervidicella metallireducens AeB TaxID=1403537 RepID=A0A017RXZ7_9CLOT|nr:endonuclease MutS2 [Fervidicella metallireducens]EYE89456.1 DNA mismatch repair protein MutS [Fervidicella metallireducens AeB]